MIRRAVGHISANNRRDNLTRWQRKPVVDGDNPNQVVQVFDHNWGKTLAFSDDGRHILDHHLVVFAERQVINALFGNDHKLRQVNRVGAFTQDLPLRTALTAVSQKVRYILEIIRCGIGSQHLHSAEWFAIPGKNISDFALSDGHHGFNVHPVLNGHQEVQTTTEHVGLIARFAIQGDEA